MGPLVVSSGGAEVEHGLGIDFLPPATGQLKSFLDHMAMSAFDLA